MVIAQQKTRMFFFRIHPTVGAGLKPAPARFTDVIARSAGLIDYFLIISFSSLFTGSWLLRSGVSMMMYFVPAIRRCGAGTGSFAIWTRIASTKRSAEFITF